MRTLRKTREFRNRGLHPLIIDYSIPWGYFDGARQGHPPNCGVGFVMYLSHSHYIHIRYTPEGGTNNRVELVALWTLLEVEKEKNVIKLQAFGDSKMTIDWANGKISIQNPKLTNIMREIKLNFRAFEQLNFHQILWELNTKAHDEISKEDLELPSGAFGFYEFHDDIESQSMEFKL
jgi:ribonuclease HI